MEKQKLSGWWYLSFAGEARYLGACVVQGAGLVDAALNARMLRCNPGGEVLGAPIPEGSLPPEHMRNRLLGLGEILSTWPDSVRINSPSESGSIYSDLN